MEVRPYLVHGMYVENNFPFQFLLHITHDKIIYNILRVYLARGFFALEVRSEIFEIFDPK
jgi:hypothetical protein